MNESKQDKSMHTAMEGTVDAADPPTVEEIASGFMVRYFRWAWWRVPLKVAQGWGFPAMAIYIYVSFPHPFLLALMLVTVIFWPGPTVFPIILYPKPVIVSERGFVICGIPFRWSEIRRLRVEASLKDRSSVAFTYNAAVKKRLKQIPLPKRHMLMVSLPPTALFTGKNDLSFPNDLNINAKDFLHILEQYAQSKMTVM